VENEKLSYENYSSANENLITQFAELKELISREEENIISKIK
jgi:hypothetical protein